MRICDGDILTQILIIERAISVLFVTSLQFWFQKLEDD